MSVIYARCPGCGVVCAHMDVEHLVDCRYQGPRALPFPAPMLDPTWTPEKGYAHALELLVIAERAEARKKEEA